MADITLDNKNNQKKTQSVFSATVTDANVGDTILNLPKGAYVVAIVAVEADGSGAGEATVTGITAGGYYPTGATVVLAGTGIGTEKVIITYIETDLANGQYTL